MKRCRLAVWIAILISVGVLVGCDSGGTGSASAPASTPTPQAKKEPVLYTGQEAFSKMLGLAIRWAPDAQPIHIESALTSEASGQGGKSAVWTGFFASPSRRTVKTIVCSGSLQPGAPAFGVSANAGEAPYTADLAAVGFQSFMLKTDSDKAYAIAQQHGGEALIKQDEKQPVTYLLEGDKKQNVPVWYVIYGKNMKDKKGIGVINANTGAFLRAGS